MNTKPEQSNPIGELQLQETMDAIRHLRIYTSISMIPQPKQYRSNPAVAIKDVQEIMPGRDRRSRPTYHVG